MNVCAKSNVYLCICLSQNACAHYVSCVRECVYVCVLQLISVFFYSPRMFVVELFFHSLANYVISCAVNTTADCCFADRGSGLHSEKKPPPPPMRDHHKPWSCVCVSVLYRIGCYSPSLRMWASFLATAELDRSYSNYCRLQWCAACVYHSNGITLMIIVFFFPGTKQ